MIGNDLLRLSPKQQARWIIKFIIRSLKNYHKFYLAMSRPGITFTDEQKEMIAKLDSTGKQKMIIAKLGE
jgi:hypothetical protein